MSDSSIQSALTVTLAALLVAYSLAYLVRRLRRRHAGLAIGLPLAVGLLARIATIGVVDGSGLSERLRGGDETTFLKDAAVLAPLQWAEPEWVSEATHHLHVAIFAAQMKLGDFDPTAMRFTQVGIAVAGLVFLIAAVHALAGPRAAVVIAWILMLEPAGVFFDSSLHKEPLMKLGTGLAVYGAARIWRHLDGVGIAVAASGGAIAVATRSYAGWFLVSGCVLLLLHAALRRMDRPLRAMPLVYAVVVVAFLATPTLLQLSSSESLTRLQLSQDANTQAEQTATPSSDAPESNSNNLALEEVDFSTREGVVTNLPKRIRDVLLRPYPWQLDNPSQVLGAIGSVIALAGMGLLLGYAWRARGRVLPVAGPIVYPLAFLLIAYALSAGNAGTGFRYRTHLVTLAFAMLIVLRSQVVSGLPHRREASGGTARPPGHTLAQPVA